MQNISRGPTFADFVTTGIRIEASMQDITVASLQQRCGTGTGTVGTVTF
jgi:hypothetical protein